MTIGIVAMMMAFGTIAANGANVAQGKNNGNNIHVAKVENKGHNNKGYNDKKGHGNKNGHNNGWNNGNHKGHDKDFYMIGKNHNHGAWGKYVGVYKNNHWGKLVGNKMYVNHCMYGHHHNIGLHKHVYAYEMINGHKTNHFLCIYCGKHKVW